MKTLIVYATKYGTAESCAKKLREKLNTEVELKNLKQEKNIDLSDYDKVIIGSSVYMGQIRKEAKKFCQENLEELKTKENAFYISCMREGEDAENQIEVNYPKELLEKAVFSSVFGGAFNFEKMNFLEKMIIKKIAGTDQSEENILEDNIAEFAKKLNAS
ncbi:flavodoxin domain-containing protein [Natronospora cellulosivora (SeqCode)]